MDLTANVTTAVSVNDGKEKDRNCAEQSDDAEQSDQSFNKDDSDIQIISVDSPEHYSNKQLSPSEAHESISSGGNTNGAPDAGDEKAGTVSADGQRETWTKSSSSPLLVKEENKTAVGKLIGTNSETTADSPRAKDISASSSPSTSQTNKPAITECNNGNHQNSKKVSSSSDSETHLNLAAIKLLQRLEFKNPGRKQIEYGLFNPEESEREKKKLRRFQTSKPRAGVCYKENGLLLDGRDVCDCLTQSCPGCFYPCPNCSSRKCGPTCRCNRKWVYDYIEDEGRTYRVEFPEQINF